MASKKHEVIVKGGRDEKTIVFTGEIRPEQYSDFEISTNVPVVVEDWQYKVISFSGREIVSDRLVG